MGAGGRRSAARRRQTSAYIIPSFNPANKSTNITLSNGDRTAQKNISGSAWYAVGGLPSKSTGKLVFAVSITTNTTTNGGIVVGVFKTSLNISTQVGGDANSYGLQCNNTSPGPTRYNNASPVIVGASGDATESGDICVVAVDFEAGKMWFGLTDKSSYWYGDPAAGTGQSYTFTPNTPLFPACSLYDNVGVITFIDPPVAAIPSGFSKWSA